MKRIILLLTLVTLLFSSCSRRGPIDEFNRHSVGLPFALAMREEEMQETETFRRDRIFGGYLLQAPWLQVFVSGWPDVLDKAHVTQYRITGGQYSVFGISVGSSIDNSASKLLRRGYVDITSKDACLEFIIKNQVRITLFYDENSKITEIWAEAVTTNDRKIVS